MKSKALALAAAMAFASSSQGAVFPSVQLVSSGIDDLLGNGLFDVYHVVISNTEGDATSASFTFEGNFLTGVGTTFQDNTDLAAGGTIGDSFIVLPPGTTALAALQVDTSTLLDVAYTVSGTTPVVPLGDTTVAVLSVPAGSAPLSRGIVGSLVINGEENPLFSWPEPSTAALVTLCLAGSVVSRRVRTVCHFT